ncbi:hypothetical protein [Pseudomonas mohnii]
MQSIVDLIDSLDRMRFHLAGTQSQPGLLQLTDAAVAGIERIDENLERIANNTEKAAAVSKQLQELPEFLTGFLLQIVKNERFTDAATESLAESFRTAAQQSTDASFEAAKARVVEAFEGLNYQAIVRAGELKNELAEKRKVHDKALAERNDTIDQYKNRLAGVDTQIDNERRRLTTEFSTHLADARKWGVRKFVAGLVIGTAVSGIYLAPMIEQYLQQELTQSPR